jgi:hypothetical protein
MFYSFNVASTATRLKAYNEAIYSSFSLCVTVRTQQSLSTGYNLQPIAYNLWEGGGRQWSFFYLQFWPLALNNYLRAWVIAELKFNVCKGRVRLNYSIYLNQGISGITEYAFPFSYYTFTFANLLLTSGWQHAIHMVPSAESACTPVHCISLVTFLHMRPIHQKLVRSLVTLELPFSVIFVGSQENTAVCIPAVRQWPW